MLGHRNNCVRAPRGHIIWIPSQLIFVLFPYCRVVIRETTNINVVIFGLTQPGLELTICRSVELIVTTITPLVPQTKLETRAKNRERTSVQHETRAKNKATHSK